MKKVWILSVIGAFCVIVAARPVHAQAIWASAGLQTNPVANAILADTGPLALDNLRVTTVACSANVASTAIFERRDATNLIMVQSQGFFVPANGTIMLSPVPRVLTLDQERLRVRLNAAIVGSIWCSVFVE